MATVAGLNSRGSRASVTRQSSSEHRNRRSRSNLMQRRSPSRRSVPTRRSATRRPRNGRARIRPSGPSRQRVRRRRLSSRVLTRPSVPSRRSVTRRRLSGRRLTRRSGPSKPLRRSLLLHRRPLRHKQRPLLLRIRLQHSSAAKETSTSASHPAKDCHRKTRRSASLSRPPRTRVLVRSPENIAPATHSRW